MFQIAETLQIRYYEYETLRHFCNLTEICQVIHQGIFVMLRLNDTFWFD